MALNLFKKRPAARIKIGNTFLGEKISATAEGYVIYKEWDAEDRTYYYWEEWELRGFNDYDSWIEYDHYTHKLALYEPLKPQQFVDPTTLKKDDLVTFTTRRGEQMQGTVTEAGVGIVARREGTLTYHVFEGDKVAYAECTGPQGSFCIEKYNDKEFDIYRKEVLDRRRQKILLGRVVAPGVIGTLRAAPLSSSLTVLAIVGYTLFSIVSSFIPSYQTFCTPRTVVPAGSRSAPQSTGTSIPLSSNTRPTPSSSSPVLPSDEITSQGANKTCYRRRVYGGGGGGAGK